MAYALQVLMMPVCVGPGGVTLTAGGDSPTVVVPDAVGLTKVLDVMQVVDWESLGAGVVEEFVVVLV